MSSNFSRASALVLLALMIPACLPPSVNDGSLQIQTTDRISVGPGGIEGSGVSENAVVSENGRYVVFQSNADNLVPGDTNLKTDIFRLNLQTGALEIVSLADDESFATNRCETPSVSADGNLIVFVSSSNLTATNVAGVDSIYRRDMTTQQTVLVSRNGAGNPTTANCAEPSISPEGQFVAFATRDGSIVPGIGADWRILVKDVSGGSLVQGSGVAAVAGSVGHTAPSISEGGLFVSYTLNENTGIGPAQLTQVYRRDVVGLADTRVSENRTSTGAGNDHSAQSKISRDGNLVLFQSFATNITLDDRTGADIFLRDMSLAQTTLVSVDSAGNGDLGDASTPSMSSDGRFIAFASDAGNLVPNDTNLAVDVFVHDRVTGKTVRASVRTFGRETNPGTLSNLPSVPLDGSFVVFQSNSPTIVDLDFNGASDIFLRTLDW